MTKLLRRAETLEEETQEGEEEEEPPEVDLSLLDKKKNNFIFTSQTYIDKYYGCIQIYTDASKSLDSKTGVGSFVPELDVIEGKVSGWEDGIGINPLLGKHNTGKCDYCEEEETVEYVLLQCRKYTPRIQMMQRR